MASTGTLEGDPQRSELDPQRFSDSTKWPGSAIFHRARQLVGRAGLTASDLDDLRQDLIVHALSQWSKFDPARATASTFLDRILRQQQFAILRRRRSRNGRSTTVPLIVDVAEDYRRQEGRTDEALCDCRYDVAFVLAGLGPGDRSLAAGLMVHSVSHIARTRQCHRQRVHEAIGQLRLRLESLGLRDYVVAPLETKG